ncbi:uncharacterized protein LOC114874602 isoform X2 [Osmia bicornis bicornis]|uniref:uncharacterized protein LOC114874602 isoform X2 n=1 Tax=Osmia bicornis bicornis TaxID=1437191 RepID=UPI0010F8BE8F|nr:uncharacterized protein LOC114874602 isoform X2 [Osmia bicornis bicornis]
MGEGKSDRSSKRQRSSQRANKSSSDSELAQGKNKGRKSKSKEKWPLLEGLTVDELVRYRRRRVEGQPKDNLGVCPETEGNDLVSEYGEAFRAKGEESLKESIWLERSERLEDLPLKDFEEGGNNTDEEDLDEQDRENIELPSEYKVTETAGVQNNDNTMETDNANSKIISHTNQPSLTRRRGALKRNGEPYPDTETYSSYVAYEGQHRPELARRPTSLKMEGDMNTMTEKCEKFIEWLNVSRPELLRVPTHLKLEGNFESSTENHDKYVPFVGVRRPELLRRNTNLKLEGEFNFVKEYADEFKRHDNKERLPPKKSDNHLNAEKNPHKENNTDKMNNNSRGKEVQLTIESKKHIVEEENKKQKKEMEMDMLISKLEDLKSEPLEIPEYKDAYKDFPRERPKIVKPEDEIGRADGSKISSSPTHKFTAKIDQDPEYKSKYLDYQRDYPVYRKPPPSVRSTLIPTEHSPRFVRQGSRRHDYELTSEVQSQYVPYGRIPRVETLKMPANLRLEGNIDLEPEYRTAYCTKRDYQLCTEPRMHRRRDRSLSASRHKENYWINSNVEQFGYKNAAQDQNAFQIVNTRVHEDTICEKPPPPTSRRGSRSSQIQAQRAMQSGMVECNTKDRSTSPTYRLHVCNVDDEQGGFRRRRSPLQSSGRMYNPSPNHVLQSDTTRPYSPSFGKSAKQHSNDQSFVILDNRIFDRNKNEIRRRRADRNYNIDSILSHSKGKTRTSTNWMPPWYDSTNTI